MEHLAFVFSCVIMISSKKQEGTAMKATENERLGLEELYKERTPYYGELHDHGATGGTSDGKRPLSHWIGAMEALNMDFAAILDHRQVRHMYLPEWEDGLFIGGTEPGTVIDDSTAEVKNVHYNMLFVNSEPLEKLLAEFTEYEFTGGPEGHFIYPHFTRARFNQLIDRVKELGGFFVHPHPKQLMKSEDPTQYWFQDETGIEVFYDDLASQYTVDNYKLWTDLLAAGKRVWACAGGDGHACASNKALTAIYAEERKNAAFLSHLREGDFVCGSVGIKMHMGSTKMGGCCSFEGEKLVFSVGDFHPSVKIPGHQYRVDVLDDTGVVCSEEIGCNETQYFTIEAKPCKFYRVEVFDTTRNLRIAIGNPIWNKDLAK